MPVTQSALDLRQRREGEEAPPRLTPRTRGTKTGAARRRDPRGLLWLADAQTPDLGLADRVVLLPRRHLQWGVLDGEFGGVVWRQTHEARRARGPPRRVLVVSSVPPLLIDDLGDPSRFHHMLRVFKPSSPMNLGTWALTAYSLPLTLLAAKQAASDLRLLDWPLKLIGKLGHSRSLDVIGIPLALTMMSYPGVLLSTTSTPLWAKSRLLGALFASTALSNGVAATRLALALSEGRESAALRRLGKIETAARICEAAALAGYLATMGRAAKPLTSGRHGRRFWVGAIGAGLIAPALIQAFKPKGRKTGLGATLLGSALTLAGGLALKWAVVHPGAIPPRICGARKK